MAGWDAIGMETRVDVTMAVAGRLGPGPLLLVGESGDGSGIEAAVARYAWLLLGAALVGIVVRRFNIPYAVALVIGGLLVEESHVVAVPQLDPTVLLFVFLPPLLFDAAFRRFAEAFEKRADQVYGRTGG